MCAAIVRQDVKQNNKTIMNKKNCLALMGALVLTAGFTACSSDDDNNGGSNAGSLLTSSSQILFSSTDSTQNANGTQIGSGVAEFTFTGKQTLKKGVYTLRGFVYIADGAELTIEPGTIIKGGSKATIIAEPGGKLIAQGTSSNPIVFTSEKAAGQRKPGDWGGVILCGKAPNNNGVLGQQIEGGPRTKHGGTDANDNSGVLSYVRIEFAGYPYEKDKEINGLTLGSVGKGTKIDHVQVSYSNDDSFEWFGGTVNCDHLIAYKGWDDDFDTDNGFSGNVQFGLALRDSRIADTSQSNGFESDNNASGTATAEPVTTCTFSNMTFIGPRADANFVNNSKYITGGDYNPNNGSALGKFQSAMQIRRASKLNCINSIAMDWPIGLIIDGEKGNTVEEAKAGNIKLQNVWFANMGVVGTDANKEYSDILCTYVAGTDGKRAIQRDSTQQSYSHSFFLSQKGNKYFDNKNDLMLTTGKGINVPFMPLQGSPLLNAISDEAFGGNSNFSIVYYIGAFTSSDTWLDGWTEFDPQNANYNTTK